MNEDTATLPVIISELEAGIESISRLQYALCHERASSIRLTRGYPNVAKSC